MTKKIQVLMQIPYLQTILFKKTMIEFDWLTGFWVARLFIYLSIHSFAKYIVISF